MDERPRYHVATVSGDIEPREGGTAKPVGLSAHVIDRPNACRVVATFRSEDQLRRPKTDARNGGTRSRGQAEARAAAEALADEWNADEARL